MLKSVWRVWFVTYQGAFAMALRIFDWDLCMMSLLDLLAQPHSSNTLRKMKQRETHFKAHVFTSGTTANSSNSKFDQHLLVNGYAIGPMENITDENITGFCILCTCLKSIIDLEVKVCRQIPVLTT